MKTRLISPSPSNIEAAARILKKGGIVAFPTETVYGLGTCVKANSEAISCIYQLKKRPTTKPLGLYLKCKEEVFDYLPNHLKDIFQRVAENFLPGPLTIVFPGKNTGASMAVRVPNHPVLVALLEVLGDPILGTSANHSNFPSAVRPQEVLSDFPEGIHMILDGGECALGVESTILSIEPLIILRQGAIPKESLEKLLGTSIKVIQPPNRDTESFGVSIRVSNNLQDVKTYINKNPSIKRKIFLNFSTKDYYSLLREAISSQSKEVIFLYDENISPFFPPLSKNLYPNRFIKISP
ncbi:L-threonylcarbamoyladenylate synthase [Chlamydiifrater volucris]|uniref:L-threonylcarbamoyladenylate synthase n=1 Tax=Chlamydiifrater volucris TaxID=2681470 RepID=UPI001BCDA849|nr:L-threonylcarbamoyladenylate synthase [Chlamydiifrater volucris]